MVARASEFSRSKAQIFHQRILVPGPTHMRALHLMLTICWACCVHVMKEEKRGWDTAIMPETSGDASGDGSRATGMETPSIILLAYRRTWQIKIGSNPD